MMENKKQWSLQKVFAMLFSFALAIVLAGFVGQKDVYAEEMSNPKTITVKVIDKATGAAIENAEVTAYVWKPTGERKYDGGADGTKGYYDYEGEPIGTSSEVTYNGNGEYTVTIECDPAKYDRYVDSGDTWKYNYRPYVFTVGASADGYVETAIPTAWDVCYYNKSNPALSTCNNYQRVIGSRMDVLAGLYGYEDLPSSFSIPLEVFDPDEEFLKYQENAVQDIEKYIRDFSKYEEADQKTLNDIIATATTSIKKATSEEKIDEIKANAIAQMDAVETSQSKVNDQYRDLIKFVKDGREVGLSGSGEDLSISLTLTNYDKNGQFKVVNGDNELKASWHAQKKHWLPSVSMQMPIDYIGNTSATGVFLSDTNKPSDVSFSAGTIEDCYVEFPDPDSGLTQKVTFTLNVVAIDISEMKVSAPSTVELERNEENEYNPIGYDVTLTTDAEEKNVAYDGKVTIKSLTPSIAKVVDGNIVPLKNGYATFEAICEDNTSLKERFSINFTLSSDEQAELAAAAEVDDLIDVIGTVTLRSEAKIKAARDAYNELNTNFGSGAQKKVKKLSLLEEAESRLQELKDIAAAKAVDDSIDAIGTVTLDSKSTIEAARAAYGKLNENAKTLVKGYDTLTAAEARLVVLNGYDENGQKLVELIAAIPEEIALTDECETAIISAKTAYDALAGEEKTFIEENYKAAIERLLNDVAALEALKAEKETADAAAEVVAKINALGTITLSKENSVQAARTAYNKLSSDAKKLVTNYATLTAAEQKIATLKKAEADKKKQAEAEKQVKALKLTLKAKAGKRKVTLTWKASSKADGYIIYRATKKNGTYKQIKVIKNWKTSSYTNTKLTSKKNYYYKICPYKGSVKGKLSAVKAIKAK